MNRPHTFASLLLTLCVLEVACASSEDADGYRFEVPSSFPPPRVPADNPMSEAKVQLGRRLFYDVRLSENETQRCATCHVQALAFTDGRPTSVGSTGQSTARGAMSLANAAYASTFNWANATLTTLEEQAHIPLFGESPVELGLGGLENLLLARLASDDRYPSMFAESFPDDANPISVQNVVRALAAFQRTLISGRSPYDQYLAGDAEALSPAALRGRDLFFGERLECFHCHGGFNFSNSIDHAGNQFDQTVFANNGLYNVDGAGGYPADNTGLFAMTNDRLDMGRFKPPSLRNIALTSPYMHDGSLETLDDVLDHYARGGTLTTTGPNVGDGSTSPLRSGFVAGFTLTAGERADVLAFLEALTDEEFIHDPRYSSPFIE